jgi:ribosomal protein S1
MVKLPKVASILSYACVLGLGLSPVAMAFDKSVEEIEAEQNSARKGSLPGLLKPDADTLKGVYTMKGKVLTVSPDYLVIERNNGKEVSLHFDETTKLPRNFSPGDFVEAKVVHYNEGHHALSIDPMK